MSTKTQITDEQAASTPVEAQPSKTQPLQEIVNMVRRDSQIEPQTYLEESKVPHGGEQEPINDLPDDPADDPALEETNP